MNLGGAEAMVMNLYRHLDRRHFQFDFAVATSEPAHHDREIREAGGRVIPHPKPALGFRNYARAFRRTLRTHGPYAAVHSHVQHFSGASLYLASLERVPVRVGHSHLDSDGGGARTLRRRVYLGLTRALLKRYATNLLGCSRAACEALYGPDCWRDPRCRVTPNAIDLRPYEETPADRRELRRSFGLPPDGRILCNVSRFEPRKNQAFLIPLLRAVIERVPEAHLLLVGDGEQRAEVKAAAVSAGLGSKVSLPGNRTEIPQLLAASDAFLFPSLREGLPVVLVEAQAAGLPCVISDQVTADADLDLNLIRRVPVGAGPQAWLEPVLTALETPRQPWAARQHAIAAAGYDVRAAVRAMESLYAGSTD